MSDFLGNLAARAVGAPTLLQPGPAFQSSSTPLEQSDRPSFLSPGLRPSSQGPGYLDVGRLDPGKPATEPRRIGKSALARAAWSGESSPAADSEWAEEPVESASAPKTARTAMPPVLPPAGHAAGLAPVASDKRDESTVGLPFQAAVAEDLETRQNPLAAPQTRRGMVQPPSAFALAATIPAEEMKTTLPHTNPMASAGRVAPISPPVQQHASPPFSRREPDTTAQDVETAAEGRDLGVTTLAAPPANTPRISPRTEPAPRTAPPSPSFAPALLPPAFSAPSLGPQGAEAGAAAARSGMAKASRQTVNVSIGRIEVNSSSKPAAPRTAGHRPFRSLSDYLKSREETRP